jgi:hypothetical protein
MKETVLLFFLFFVCSVGPAKSAPTISDVSAEGQNVTVNGSGFGNHGLDIKWLGGLHGAIESMPQGERPSLGGWNFSSSTSITVASDQAHSGSQSIKSVLGNNQPGEAIISHAWSDRIHANQYIFSSWWVRRTHIGQCSWKMFQLNWQNATSRFDYPQLSMFIDPGNTARLLIRPGPDYANVSRDLSPPFPEQDDRWYRMDLNIHTSAVGSKNGTCTVSLHDPTGKTAIITKTLSDIMSFSDSQGYYQYRTENSLSESPGGK